MRDQDELFAALAQSEFRSRFRLEPKEASYLKEKTLPVVLEHGRRFIVERLANAQASNGNPFDVQSQLMVKGERTMTRVAVTLLVLLSMAVNHNRAFAAEPQRPVKKVQGFGSPTEAWEAFAKAGEARDWGSVYDCFTPMAQDKMTFDCLLGLKFGVAWFNLEKSDDKELRHLPIIATNCTPRTGLIGSELKRRVRRRKRRTWTVKTFSNCSCRWSATSASSL